MGSELTPESPPGQAAAADNRDRAILEHLADPVLILDSKGIVLWASRAALALGLNAPAIAGTSAFSSIEAADRDRFRQALRGAVEQPGTAVAVTSIWREGTTGRRLCFNDTLTYLPDTPGIAGVLLCAHHTHRPEYGSASGHDGAPLNKQVEHALRQNEERLRQVARLSATGIFDHDHLSGEIYWSPEQREIYGIGPDEPIRFSVGGEDPNQTWSLIYVEDRANVAAQVSRAHQDSTGVYDVEHRIVRRDGSLRWVSSRSQTFFEGEGPARRAVRTIGAVRDITDNKRVGRQLRLTQESVDRSNTAIYWISLNGRITYANEHACQNLGRTPEEMLDLQVWDLDPTVTKARWDAMNARLDSHRSLVTRTRHYRKDGSHFPVEINGNLVMFDGDAHVFVFARDITETEHAERNLELLNAAINSSRTPFFTSDHAGRIVYANDYAHESLGYTRQELLGRYVWDIDPGVNPTRYQELWELLKRERRVTLPTTHQRKDGSTIPVEVTTSYFSFRGEEYSLTFAQDITERQRTELALRQSQERLQQVLAVYDIGIFEEDRLAGTAYWSPELRKTLQVPQDLPPDEESFTRSIHPEDVEKVLAAANRARDPNGDGRFDVQLRFRRSDGELRWMDARSQTFFAGQGADRHMIRTVGALVDVTARRQVDEALRVSERSLREAQSIAHIGNWDMDPATGRVTWSDEVYRVFEVDPREFTVSYETFLTLVHPEDRTQVHAAWNRSLTQFVPYQITHRIVTRAGRVKHIEDRGEADFGPDGIPRMWRGTSQDVTSRVVAEEAVRQSLQEKETLLREIHHRVKNNLQIIASLLHFQSKRVRDPADVAAFTDGRNRLRAMILVHEKLYQSKDLSNIEFGNYLRSLVNDLYQSYSADGRRLQLEVTADPVALPVQIAAPCGMIVCELLTNAFKYAFPGGGTGRVTVFLTAADGKLRLCVQDDGVGLPEAFDPKSGSSFGWQLIRNLAAQISGTIQIDRTSGTRVIIDFRNEAAG